MKGAKKALSIRLPGEIYDKATESMKAGISKSIAQYTVDRLFLSEKLEVENKLLKEENEALKKETKDIQKRNNDLQQAIINALNKVTK